MDNMDLRMALIGYEQELDRITGQITELKRRLGHKSSKKNNLVQAKASGKKKHRISPEGLERIRQAQKRRWAAAKKGD